MRYNAHGVLISTARAVGLGAVDSVVASTVDAIQQIELESSKPAMYYDHGSSSAEYLKSPDHTHDGSPNDVENCLSLPSQTRLYTDPREP